MRLEDHLLHNQEQFNWIFKDPYIPENGLRIHLGKKNPQMSEVNIQDMRHLEDLISGWLQEEDKIFAYGGYAENRDFYKRSDIFTGPEIRTIHLGTDFWLPAGTEILLPVEGTIHSFNDNAGKGNYGPTIVTAHQINNRRFFMLWGHLSRISLQTITRNAHIDQGQPIGHLGDYDENGEWPPHLHLQIIEKMYGSVGDYPGVAALSEADFYLNNCPDPQKIFDLN